MQLSSVRTLPQTTANPGAAPLFARFLGKLVLDVLPAALASVIGGFLFTQYHFDHAVAPQTVAVQPASAEMMAMVRDEHTLIMNYLKAQTAAEQKRDSTEDTETARAVSQAKAAEKAAEEAKLTSTFASTGAAQPSATPAVIAKAVPAHSSKAAVVRPVPTPQAPLLIAQAGPVASADAPADDRLARDPNSLLAKTLDIKDHVVAATHHVVSAIGDVFGSVGETITGVIPIGRQFSSES